MSGPSNYVRQAREAAARRRLELVKILRDDPDVTNLKLAKALGVNRHTIASDRKEIMTQLVESTKTETEILRDGVVQELESLRAEVEKHRKTDGKLSLQAVDRLIDITKVLIELTGVKKPVVEKKEVTHRRISFATTIVATDGQRTELPTKEPLTLEG